MKWVNLVGGYGFILLGIAGIILPILPGWIFVIIGLVLLSREEAWARRWRDKLRARFPQLNAPVDRLEAWFDRQVAKLTRGT